MAGRGSVGLGELVEDMVKFVWRDADTGVPDRDPKLGFAVALPLRVYLDEHMTSLGELDGVGHQVGENLADAPWIDQTDFLYQP